VALVVALHPFQLTLYLAMVVLMVALVVLVVMLRQWQ
jgi:hypothetical protein